MDQDRALFELALRRKVMSRTALERCWSEAAALGLAFEGVLRPRLDPVDFLELVRARERARLRRVLERARLDERSDGGET